MGIKIGNRGEPIKGVLISIVLLWATGSKLKWGHAVETSGTPTPRSEN